MAEKRENKRKLNIHALLQYKNSRTFKTMKNKFPRADIEPQKGNTVKCIEYIKKEGYYKEMGTPQYTGHGYRNDLSSFGTRLLENGEKLKDLALETNNLQQLKHLESLHECIPPKSINRNIVWIYGPPRTGKTTYARNKGAEPITISEGGGFYILYWRKKYSYR